MGNGYTPADYDPGGDPVIPRTRSPFLPNSVPGTRNYLQGSNIDQIERYVGQPVSRVPGSVQLASARTTTPPTQLFPPDQPTPYGEVVEKPPRPFSTVDPNSGLIFPPRDQPRPPREQVPRPGQGTLTPPITSPSNPYFMSTPRGQPAQTPFQPQIQRYSNEYGLPPALFNALIGAESNFHPHAVSSSGAVGLGQLEPGTGREMGVNNPYDPDQNLQGAARYLRQMYDRYGSWSKAVSAYNRGPGGAEKTGFSLKGYTGYPQGAALIATAAALDTNLVKAGPLVPPPQNYRPVSYTPRGGYPSMFPDRPSSMWGKDSPGMFEGPGAIPHQREIGGVLGGLAPFLMIGLALFSKGAALPMLSAYAGYQTARNQRRDKDAKELKTFYQDKLKETKAKLGLEQGDAAAAMAMPPGPERDEALRRIAMEYGDPDLQAIVEQGGDPTKLFQLRDKAYQDISKTDQAERLAMQEERLQLTIEKDALERKLHEAKDPLEVQHLQEEIKKLQQQQEQLSKGIGAEQAPDPGSEAAPASPEASPETPAAEPSPEAPAAGPSAPAPEAPTTPPSGEAPAAPAESAPAPSPGRGAEAAPATGGEDQVVDAQGRPVARRGDVVPADYRGPAPQTTPAAATAPAEGQPPTAPTTSVPDVGVGGLGPANLPPQLQQKVTGLSPERLDQDARQFLETQKPPYSRLDPLAVPRNEAVARRASQMQAFIDHVIATTKPGDIDSAFQKLDTVDPGMASIARAVDRGDMPGPSGWQLRTPLYQNVQKLVTSLDPTWDASRWVTNYRTKVAYHVGTQSNQIRSANTALAHMSTLWDMADAMHNGQFPTINAMRNWWKTQTGHEAATDFVAARAAVARELERAFRGSAGAWGEIKEDLKNVNENSSPEQIQGYVRTVTELLKGQLDSLADLYQGGTGKKTVGDDLLSPAARATFHRFERLELGAGGAPIPQAGAEPSVLDDTATYPPASAYGPGPAPVEVSPSGGWSAQPEQ